jgi:hypothetical protein
MQPFTKAVHHHLGGHILLQKHNIRKARACFTRQCVDYDNFNIVLLPSCKLLFASTATVCHDAQAAAKNNRTALAYLLSFSNHVGILQHLYQLAMCLLCHTWRDVRERAICMVSHMQVRGTRFRWTTASMTCNNNGHTSKLAKQWNQQMLLPGLTCGCLLTTSKQPPRPLRSIAHPYSMQNRNNQVHATESDLAALLTIE